MHFVNGEKLISAPSEELSRVQDFLGLKRVDIEEEDVEDDDIDVDGEGIEENGIPS